MLPSLIPIHDENPTERFSYVTVALIVINVAAFVLLTPNFGIAKSRCFDRACVAEQCALEQFFFEWGTVPVEVTEGEQLTGDLGGRCLLQPKSVILSVFTAMFLHGGFLHLAGNMLFLWIFGNNIEDRLGPFRFVVFYLAAGLAGSLAHVALNPASQVPTIGASGAISGLLGAYIVLFPHARIHAVVPIPILFFIFGRIRLPAFVVLGIWFVSQFFIGGGQQPEGGGVAWVAHVGGFVAGMVLIFVLGGWRPQRPRPSYYLR
jgi:membrane associated rhomboid family serine protease